MKDKSNNQSAHLTGFQDGHFGNPPADLSKVDKNTKEEYTAGYEEGRIETSEKWKYVNDK